MSKVPLRKIIHIDMDCYYAAIEIRDNPKLRGLPVAVGGKSDRRGVLTTANYEARKFGVRSAQPTSQALRLCPQLILIPPHFEKYKAESQRIHKIFREFTDLIEPISLDEAYLDVSSSIHHEGSATKIAHEIRTKIFRETALTASAGIAPNKFLAKIASDWKKPNGQFTISPGEIAEFIKTLEIKKIPGVGPVTAEKLHTLGFKTCQDLQRVDAIELEKHFGSFGKRLFSYCRGIDQREVQTNRVRKTLSVEVTYPKDIPDELSCLEQIPRLMEQLENRLARSGVTRPIKSLVVKVKFFDFEQTTIETLSSTTSQDLYRQLLQTAFRRGSRPVRLIGLGVRFSEKPPEAVQSQLSLPLPQA